MKHLFEFSCFSKYVLTRISQSEARISAESDPHKPSSSVVALLTFSPSYCSTAYLPRDSTASAASDITLGQPSAFTMELSRESIFVAPVCDWPSSLLHTELISNRFEEAMAYHDFMCVATECSFCKTGSIFDLHTAWSTPMLQQVGNCLINWFTRCAHKNHQSVPVRMLGGT